MKQNPKIKHLTGVVIIVISTLVIVFSILLIISNYSIKTTTILLSSAKVKEAIKIVQISDLHSKDFGNNNKKLVNKIVEQNPDVIFMTGDMIDQNGSPDTVCNLIKQLSSTTQVYFSLGNHELLYADANGNEYIKQIENAGATVLEKKYIDTIINGTNVRIGGVSGYALGVKFWEDSYGKSSTEHYNMSDFSEQRFLLDYEKTDSLTLLLCHQPEGATLWNNNNWYAVDYVFSGHTHGGLVRLPFIGGLYAPEEGWFPKYDYGLYTINGTTTYITSGLAGSIGIPRFGNLPEVAIFTISPE